MPAFQSKWWKYSLRELCDFRQKRKSGRRFFSTESFCLCWIPQPFFIGQQGWERRDLKYRKQSGANSNSSCGKDSNVQYMAHLLNQVSYSRIINSEYNSEFENTDETDHHFAPKQSHQQPSRGGKWMSKMVRANGPHAQEISHPAWLPPRCNQGQHKWCDVKSLTLYPRWHLENHPDREMFLDINSPPYQGATEACKRCVGPR